MDIKNNNAIGDRIFGLLLYFLFLLENVKIMVLYKYYNEFAIGEGDWRKKVV